MWLDDTRSDLLDYLVTGVYGTEEADAALADSDGTIKTVIVFDR